MEDKRKAQRFFVPAISAPMKCLFQESVTRAIFMKLLWDGAVIEQVRQIGGVGCVAEEWSAGAEDFLHGAQIRRMGEVERAGIGNAIHVLASALRNYDLANGVVEVVRVVARDAVLFGFVKPDNDYAVLFVGPGSHDHGN